jgi:hypothetical protein
VAGLLCGAALVSVVGIAGSLPIVAASWALGGAAGQLVLVAINTTVLSGDHRGRGGAISMVHALRFVGTALAPAVFTAPYHADAALGFLLPALLLALTVPAAARLRERPARS